jgi:hypothetical protein
MTLDRQLGLLPEGTDQRGSTLHGFEPSGGVSPDLGDGVQAQVGEFALFGVAEQIFDGIELRGIGGQAFQDDVAVERIDVVADQAAAVRGQPIPDDQQLALDLGAQGLEEFDQLWPLDRAVEEAKVDVPEARPGDERELLPVEAVLEGRRATLGGPGLDPRRTLAQSRFVDEDDGPPVDSGVFFSTGQRLVFQLPIAASSRCSARPAGRWLEKPNSRTTRQTCTVLKA